MLYRRLSIILIATLFVCVAVGTGVAIAESGAEQFDETDSFEDDNSTAISDSSASDDELTAEVGGGEQATEVAVTVAPPGDGSFTTDDTVDIFLGAYEQQDLARVGLEDEELNVTVDRPDDQQDVFSVETDADGSASVEYDLSDVDEQMDSGAEGIYEVSVTDSDGEVEATIEFTVGPTVDILNNRNTAIFVGEENTVSVLLREGEFGVEDEPVEASITDPNGEPVVSEAEETDENGIIELTFTPEEAGDYQVEVGGPVDDDMRTITATEVTMGGERDLRDAKAGEENAFGGYLRTADGQLANTDVTVNISESGFDGDFTTEFETTTDEGGFFLAEYDLPEDVERDLDVEVETDDGDIVESRFDTIWVEAPSDDDDDEDDPEPELNVDSDEFFYAPGEQIEFEVEALDEDGQPITNTEVDLFAEWDFGGAPAFSRTVETDADGTATETFTVPDNAPEAVWIDGEAAFEHDSNQVSDSFGAEIRALEIFFNSGDMVAGEETEFSIEATDAITEDDEADIPMQFGALFTNYKSDSYEAGQLVTDEDGTDSVTVDVPADIGPRESINYVNRYTQTGTNRIPRIEHPGSMTIIDAQDDGFRQIVAPGEEIELEFETPDGTDVSGIAFVQFSPADQTLATEISGEETVTIPDSDQFESGDRLDVAVWTADEDGEFYTDTVFLEVDDIDLTIASFDVEPENPSIEEPVTFDASDSTAETGDLTYEWEFGDGDETTTTDPVVEHTYDEESEFEVTLTVVDEDGTEDSTSEQIAVVDEANLVTTIEAEDEQPLADGLKANVTVANDGSVSVTDEFVVDLDLNGTNFTDSDFTDTEQFTVDETLEPGENVTETVTSTNVTDERVIDDVDLVATADPDDNVDETTTETNVDTATVELTYADLNVDAYAPDSVAENKDVTLRSFVTNDGTLESEEADLTVNVTDEDGETVYENESITVSELDAEQVQRDRFETSFDDAGTYNLTVDAEDDRFPETATNTTEFVVEPYKLDINNETTRVESGINVDSNSTVVFGFETNAAEDVEATLELPEEDDAVEFAGDSEAESKTENVDAEADQTNVVRYDLQTTDETASDVELTFTVEDTIDADESASTEEVTNVTVPTETIREDVAVTFSDESDEEEDTFELYSDDVVADQSVEIDVQAGADGRTLQGLEYLVEYPFGCVEQTTSAFLGALNTDEYYDDRLDEDGNPIEIDDNKQEKINDSIEEGIDRLEADGERGQLDDGSWNQWGREGQSGQSYFSSYALLGVSSVANNEDQAARNEDGLDNVDFDDAVDWIADENWNQPDGYLNDEEASTGFTMVALSEASETNRIDSETEDQIVDIYAAASLELLESQQETDEGVTWNDEARSTALAVHGLQLALETEAYETDDELEQADLNEAIDGGVDWLEENQQSDGSWEAYRSVGFNNVGDQSETTATALLALNETGVETDADSVEEGVTYLVDQYERDGSWGYPRATQASILALNELTPGAADRTVEIELNGEDGTFEQSVSVDENDRTETIELDGSDIEDITPDDDTGSVELRVTENGDGIGTVVIAADATQEVETGAIGGDDE